MPGLAAGDKGEYRHFPWLSWCVGPPSRGVSSDSQIKREIFSADVTVQPQTKSETSATLSVAYPGNRGKNVFAPFFTRPRVLSALFLSIYINVNNSNNTGKSCP